MSLKSATTFAIAGTIVSLVLGLFNWFNNLLHLITYVQESVWLMYTIWILSILSSSIPILAFLIVLRKKQQ